MQKTNNPSIRFWPLFFAQIIIILLITLVEMPEWIKFLLFCLFSYTFGQMFSNLKKQYSSEIIDVAIKGALSVFGIFLAAGVALLLGGIRLGYRMGALLFWSLLALIVTRLIFFLGNGLSYAHKILSFFGIILFAIYVMYDTNLILQRDYQGDFITASMDYYLDILNLFTNLLDFNND
jgi:FtsH-binding integral membrane protein